MAARKSQIEILREGSIIESSERSSSKSFSPLRTGIIGDSPSDTKLRRQRDIEKHSLEAQLKLEITAVPFPISQSGTNSSTSTCGDTSPTQSSTSSSRENLPPLLDSVSPASSTPWAMQVAGVKLAKYPGYSNPSLSAPQQTRADPRKPSNTSLTQQRPSQITDFSCPNTPQNYCSKDCPCGGKTIVGHAKARKTGRLETMLKQ